MAKPVVSTLACRRLTGSLAWPLVAGSFSTWPMIPLALMATIGWNVSEAKPDRRTLFGFCLRATESSDPVRCRLRGLRAATLAGTAVSGENMARPGTMLCLAQAWRIGNEGCEATVKVVLLTFPDHLLLLYLPRTFPVARVNPPGPTHKIRRLRSPINLICAKGRMAMAHSLLLRVLPVPVIGLRKYQMIDRRESI